MDADADVRQQQQELLSLTRESRDLRSSSEGWQRAFRLTDCCSAQLLRRRLLLLRLPLLLLLLLREEPPLLPLLRRNICTTT